MSEEPDLDLLEYVLVSAPAVEALAPPAIAVAGLVHAGSLRVLDAVVLVRPAGRASVHSASTAEHPSLGALHDVVDGRVHLSAHDIDLAALTLAPAEAALLLLVENRWADALSLAVRGSGARLTAGEHIERARVEAALAPYADRIDLLLRGPGTRPSGDQVEQVRRLARLVDRGILGLDRYDVQRRRVLEG